MYTSQKETSGVESNLNSIFQHRHLQDLDPLHLPPCRSFSPPVELGPVTKSWRLESPNSCYDINIENVYINLTALRSPKKYRTIHTYIFFISHVYNWKMFHSLVAFFLFGEGCQRSFCCHLCHFIRSCLSSPQPGWPTKMPKGVASKRLRNCIPPRRSLVGAFCSDSHGWVRGKTHDPWESWGTKYRWGNIPIEAIWFVLFSWSNLE